MKRIFHFMIAFIVAGLWGLHPAKGQTVARGDASQLPPIDTHKTFTTGMFKNADRQFETRSLEFKNTEPPAYHGNLNNLPMTEWSNGKNDIYPKTLALKDFEVQKALGKWSNKSEAASKPPVATYESNLSIRKPSLPEEPVPSKTLPSARVIGGEDLILLINKGVLPDEGRVRIGHGFGRMELRDGQAVPASPPFQDEYPRSLKP